MAVTGEQDDANGGLQRHPGLLGEDGIVRTNAEESATDLGAVLDDDLDNPAQSNARGVDPMRPSSAIRRAYGINAGEGLKPGRHASDNDLMPAF